MKVELAQYEREQAILCGTLRHKSSWGRHRDRNAKTRQTEEERLAQHINGAAAELAVAKLLNRYWHASVDTFWDGADVGKRVQVRWRSKPHYDLIVRDGDKDEHFFFLVLGEVENGLDVKGYISGQEAKRPQWLKKHGGHREAYFVPQDALAPIKTNEAA